MKNNTTDIIITLSIKDTDDPKIDPLDFIEAKIVHNDCGNKKLDEFADNLGTMFSFFLQQLTALKREKLNEKNIDSN